MTKNQIAILEHTLKNKLFGTTLKCQNGKDCESLVKMGFMTKRKAAAWMGDDFIYFITEEGKNALKGQVKNE